LPKPTKKQIVLIAAAVGFFLVLPISICAFMFIQIKEIKTSANSSYEQTPDVNWGRLVSRAFNQNHNKRLLKAHFAISSAQRNLAEGKNQAARSEIEVARAIYEDELGADNIMVCTALSLAAELETKDHNYEAAEKYNQRIVEICKKQPVNRYASMARIELAQAKERNYDLPGAISVLKESLALQEKALGKNNFGLIETLNQLGEYLAKNNQPAQAETILHRGLQIAIDQKSVPWQRDCYSKLGSVYFNCGKNAEAEIAFQNLHEISKERSDWKVYALERLSANEIELREFDKIIAHAGEALQMRGTKELVYQPSLVFDSYALAYAYYNKGMKPEYNQYLNSYLKQVANFNSELDYGSDQIDYGKNFILANNFDAAKQIVLAAIAFDERKSTHGNDKHYRSIPHKRDYAQLLALANETDACRKYLNEQVESQKKLFKQDRKQVMARLAYQDYATDLIAFELVSGDKRLASKQLSELKSEGGELSTVSTIFVEALKNKSNKLKAGEFGTFCPPKYLSRVLENQS